MCLFLGQGSEPVGLPLAAFSTGTTTANGISADLTPPVPVHGNMPGHIGTVVSLESDFMSAQSQFPSVDILHRNLDKRVRRLRGEL